MTPTEFKVAMQNIADSIGGNRDEEIIHAEMDGLLVGTLIELGYEEGCEIFEEQMKWYA